MIYFYNYSTNFSHVHNNTNIHMYVIEYAESKYSFKINLTRTWVEEHGLFFNCPYRKGQKVRLNYLLILYWLLMKSKLSNKTTIGLCGIYNMFEYHKIIIVRWWKFVYYAPIIVYMHVSTTILGTTILLLAIAIFTWSLQDKNSNFFRTCLD